MLSSTYPRWQGDPEPSFVHELSRRLVDDFNVTVLCPSAPGALDKEVMDGVEVIRYRYAPRLLQSLVSGGGIIANIRANPFKVLLLPSFLMCQLITALWICYRHRPTVVHAHWLIPQGLIAAIICALYRRRIPFVVTSHGTDVWGLKGPLVVALKKWVAHSAAGITVVSRPMVSELRSQVGALENIIVAPMGVDLESLFVDKDKGCRSRDQILSVGRLVKGKGVEYLVSAMPHVIREFPNVKLLVVGDGPEKVNLERLSRSLGVEEFCQFVGQQPQGVLPELYRSSTVFVAPFLREGLGLVCVEALGCGCPVIASDIPAMADVSIHTDGINLVPCRDSKALADTILAILRKPDSEQAKVRQSIPAIRARFGWSSVSTAYSAAIRRAAHRL